ncbi:hypothetical protein [Winogradskyella sp. J14-2]|nr:hypothetical protein [Winogradskyella sp. J14-2]
MNTLQKLRLRLLKTGTRTSTLPEPKVELSPKAKDANKTVKDDDAFMFI